MQRTIVASSAIVAILLIGGFASACDPNSPPSQPVDNPVSNVDTVTSTTDPFTTDPVTTTAPPVTEPTQEPAQEPTQEPATQAAPPPIDTESACGSGDYVNSDGQCVPRPESASSPPSGATAICKDGEYSFSKHRSGTCSGHGGVMQWLN